MVQHLDTLPMEPDDVPVSIRRSGLLTWQHGTQLRAYECNTFASYTVDLPEPVVALGEYPRIPAHFIPATLPDELSVDPPQEVQP